MLTYINPRMKAVIPDWPNGRHRTTATFEIEQHPTRGERGTRVTLDPRTGKPGAPKVLTYAKKVRIVNGSDGKTYLAQLRHDGFVVIRGGDMRFDQESIWPGDERWSNVLALFDAESASSA